MNKLDISMILLVLSILPVLSLIVLIKLKKRKIGTGVFLILFALFSGLLIVGLVYNISYKNRLILDNYKVIEERGYKTLLNIPILYISLMGSDRLSILKNVLKDIGDTYHISAIWGEHPISGYIQPAYYDDHNGCTYAEVGCSLSHIKAAKFMYDNNWEYSLIIEDDAVFSLVDKWDKSLKEIAYELTKKDKDWTTCQLFWSKRRNPPREYETEYEKITGTYKTQGVGCVAYLLSRRGAEIIKGIKNLNSKENLSPQAYKFNPKMVADTLIYNFNGAKNYIYYPRLFQVNTDMKSYISGKSFNKNRLVRINKQIEKEIQGI